MGASHEYTEYRGAHKEEEHHELHHTSECKPQGPSTQLASNMGAHLKYKIQYTRAPTRLWNTGTNLLTTPEAVIQVIPIRR